MQSVMGQQRQVECPICQAKMFEREINQHIDMMHVEAFSPAVQASPKRQRLSREAAPGSEAASSSLDRSGAGSAAAPIGLVLQIAIDESTREVQPPPESCAETAINADTCAPTLVNADICAETLVTADECMETLVCPDTPLGDIGGGSQCTDGLEAPADTGIETLATPAADSPNVMLSLQPEEHLKAHLLGARTHALRCMRDDSNSKHARVAELCGEVQHDIEERRQDFARYPVMAKPADHNQQCARNELRGDLESISQKVQDHLHSVMVASGEPAEACRLAKATHFEKIDSVIAMLQQHRAESTVEFQKCFEEEASRREASEAAALALEPSLECVNNFVLHLVQEVDEETTKAIKVHTEKLEDLEAEQMRFVNANDSPQRNPTFAKVIADIGSTTRVLEEHRGQSDAYKELAKNWDEALERMPKQGQPLAATPGKRSLLDRMLGRS